MLALAERGMPVEEAAIARDSTRTPNGEEKAIDTLHYFVVFILGREVMLRARLV